VVGSIIEDCSAQYSTVLISMLRMRKLDVPAGGRAGTRYFFRGLLPLCVGKLCPRFLLASFDDKAFQVLLPNHLQNKQAHAHWGVVNASCACLMKDTC
jgi:hypothetical protein